MRINEKDPAPARPIVRLSQCMIVKNEEKNIERALSWAKDVAFEQIVVDTGSTDRTVEIAEKMGAKVYHFEWINDFSAAKNYAIEQASGNWIAFLDADEYFSPVDTKKLMVFLNRIESDPEMREKYLVVNCPWVNVDDDGNPFSVFDQDRVFRNLPETRYIGRIHEKLNQSYESVVRVDEINIIHTGYTKTAHEETSKADRNVVMLRAALKDNPDDLNTKAYLADSLGTKAWLDGPEGAVSLAEAGELFEEVINGDVDNYVYPMLKTKAYLHFIRRYIDENDPGKYPECEEMCHKALRDVPGDIDLEYYYAALLNSKNEFREAWELLSGCEAKLAAADLDASIIVSANPGMLFGQMLIAAQGLGDVGNVIKYATYLLSIDKSDQGVLSPYIYTLLNNGTSEDEVLRILSGIYDFGDPGDLLLIARAAKDCGAINIARYIIEIAGRVIKSKNM